MQIKPDWTRSKQKKKKKHVTHAHTRPMNGRFNGNHTAIQPRASFHTQKNMADNLTTIKIEMFIDIKPLKRLF